MMRQPFRKKSPTALTSRGINELLPAALTELSHRLEDRPDLIVAAWPAIVGPRFAQMSKATTFVDGILSVIVHNSTLLFLLQGRSEKDKILKELRLRFPAAKILGIQCKIG